MSRGIARVDCRAGHDQLDTSTRPRRALADSRPENDMGPCAARPRASTRLATRSRTTVRDDSDAVGGSNSATCRPINVPLSHGHRRSASAATAAYPCTRASRAASSQASSSSSGVDARRSRARTPVDLAPSSSSASSAARPFSSADGRRTLCAAGSRDGRPAAPPDDELLDNLAILGQRIAGSVVDQQVAAPWRSDDSADIDSSGR